MAALDFPASPSNGDTFGNWIYNSSKVAWQSKPLTPAKTTNSPTAPTSPADGDQWFNTNNGSLYIYYTDANTSQWVESRAPITADGYISPNYIINGAFDFWQRGTTFTSTQYGPDRWWLPISGGTITQETSDLPAGFTYGVKYSTTANTQFGQFNQALEYLTVQPLRGKVVTVSGYVKITGSFAGNWISNILYSSASELYANQTTSVASKVVATSATTSWTRFSHTFTIPSNAAGLRIENIPDSQQPNGVVIRMTGLQLEEGTIATPFRRHGGTIQGEQDACLRFYQRIDTATSGYISNGGNWTTNQFWTVIPLSVVMRTPPTVTTSSSDTFMILMNGTNAGLSSLGISGSETRAITLGITPSSSSVAGTPGFLRTATGVSLSSIAMSSEL